MNVTDNDINQVLIQMRRMAALAQAPAETSATPAAQVSFGSVLENALGGVNQMQQQASRLAGAFELGDPRVDLAQVMVESQKASVAFQGLTQVRNKLLSAYQDVMNMQV